MINTDELKFDEKGLIPAVIVDNKTNRVLTLAYMNRESLMILLKKSLHVFSAVQDRNFGLKAKRAEIISMLFR